jgi:hypothetical protein
MLLGCNKYLSRFLLKPLVMIGFIFSFSIAASAQVYYNHVVGKYPLMNPLLFDAFKKPVKPNPLLSEYIKPSKFELMHWPYFPLTPAQVEARDREWKRKNKQSIGRQIVNDIADDIIKTQVNSLIYGKKTPVAVRPKF